MGIERPAEAQERDGDETPPTSPPREVAWGSFAEACGEVTDRFRESGAAGLILVDASPLARIEELAGPTAFERAFQALKDRIVSAVERVLAPPFRIAPGPYEQQHVLTFVDRPRVEWGFFVHGLASAAGDLRRMLAGQLRKIAYPYLPEPAELAVGHAFAFWRPFQRPESQVRQLVEAALAAARFELERVRRERRTELEWILLEQQIRCVYEPIVQLSDGLVIGYEGLARGPDDSDLHSPIALFASAETCGLDYELDCLCRQLALRGARDLAPGMKLFINCLPASVHDPLFRPEEIREQLERIGLSPRDLVLEISERQSIVSYGIFREAIARFAGFGFGIAVDDMGAGYSSLATALELRPHFLKIDRSLITGIEGDPPRQDMIRAIQVLAERTGAKVVAEGVESQLELEALLDIGIACGQGFLFGPGAPTPARSVQGERRQPAAESASRPEVAGKPG
jgi:EAL domain-containing protein (putative c-di-GMP-specific phosphodiesterase class I)